MPPRNSFFDFKEISSIDLNSREGNEAKFCDIIAIIFAIFYAMANILWISANRKYLLFDIDESGYLSMALDNLYALRSGEFDGWISSVMRETFQPPVVPALASALMAVNIPPVWAAFSIPVIAGSFVVFLVYLISKAIMPPVPSLFASALIAGCPGIVNYSRSYHFSIPAAAVFLFALYCMIRSRGFSSSSWSCMFGLAVGIMPLVRTMTVAFIPGIFISSTILLFQRKQIIFKRIIRMILSFIIAIAAIGIWLVATKAAAIKYLLDFGYGARAAEFGSSSSILNLDSWLITFNQLINFVQVPYSLFFIAGLCSAAFEFLKRVIDGGKRLLLFTYLESKVVSILVVLIQIISSLTSTQNKGSAFILPAVPLLTILSVYSINMLLDSKLFKVSAGLVGGLLAACSFILFLNIVRFPHIKIILPIIDWTLPVLDDRSVYEIYAGYYDANHSDERFKAIYGFNMYTKSQGSDRNRYWSESLDSIANYLLACTNSNTAFSLRISYGVRHFLLNPSSLRSRLLLSHDAPIFLKQTMIEPILFFKGTEYQNWFNSDNGSQDFLLTLSSSGGSLFPAVNQQKINAYARQFGYSIVKSWALPSRQYAYLWFRQQSPFKSLLFSEKCLPKD